MTEAEDAQLRAELALWDTDDWLDARAEWAVDEAAGEPANPDAGADRSPATGDAMLEAHDALLDMAIAPYCPVLSTNQHRSLAGAMPVPAVQMHGPAPSATFPLIPDSVPQEHAGSLHRSRIVPLRMALHGLVLVLLLLALVAEPVWQTLAGLPLPMQVVAASSAPLDAGGGQGTGATAPDQEPHRAVVAQGTGATGSSEQARSLVVYHIQQAASGTPTNLSLNEALPFKQPTTRIAVGPDGIITRTAYAADGRVVAVLLEQAGEPLVFRTYAYGEFPSQTGGLRYRSTTLEYWAGAAPMNGSRLITIDPQQAQVVITDRSGAMQLDRMQGWVLDADGRLQSDGVYRYTYTDAGPQITWNGLLVAGAGRGLWADILREHPPQIAVLGNRVATPATATVWDGTQWIQIATGWYIAEADEVVDWHVDGQGQVVGVRDAAGTVAPVRLATADESTAATVATWAIAQRLAWLPSVFYHVVNSTEWLLVHQTSLLAGAVLLVLMNLALPLVRRGYYYVQGRAVPVLVGSVRTRRG